jgi:F-type H+-transporting ATPase subunit alpha
METFSLGSLNQLVTINKGHGTNEMHWQFGMLIRNDIAAEKLTEVLKQPQYMPLSVAEQIVILYAANEGYLDDIENSNIQKFKNDLCNYVKSNLSKLVENLNSGASLSDDDKTSLADTINTFKMIFK